MKQVLQSLKDGTTALEEVPVPQAGSGQLLIRTKTTLISAGTERMLVKFGRSGWISKARQQPEKVRQVLQKVGTDGLMATVDAIKSKLDQPLALGYCNTGYVEAVGAGVEGFEPGDRVVSNGNHAEFVAVPKNLCAKIPPEVSFDYASFTVLGAIGLQGIRLVKPTLGENIVVIGLGVIGLLTVQMLKANGCRVLGIDFDKTRLALARRFGAETVCAAIDQDVLDAAISFSRGRGVDAVIITASTDSDQPMSLAAQMCRQRGRIVLVGVAGLQLNRADFYEKELTFQVSCSYGPGRYDRAYEEKGNDYPIGHVRWTEQRNFEAVLELMASAKLDPAPIITHRYKIEDAKQALDLLTSDEGSLGILIDYNDSKAKQKLVRTVTLLDQSQTPSKANVAFLGAGNYTGRVLIPAFKRAGASLSTIVSKGGVSAVHFGKKYGFSNASSDAASVMDDLNTDTIVIGTRHNIHAEQVLGALRAGKHIFCEKPLCLTNEELLEIEQEARSRPNQLLMLGFNRRFAPQIIRIKELLEGIEAPKNFIVTVNAGEIPAGHWIQDISVGGRRIIGEGCHFIDLLRHLAGAPISQAQAIALGKHPSMDVRDDKVVISLEFEDGSVGVIHYLANGHKALAKERLEVFASGRVLILNNFRQLKTYGWKGFKGSRLWKQDKGNYACVAAFVDAVKIGGSSPIPLDEIIESSRVSIELGRSLL